VPVRVDDGLITGRYAMRTPENLLDMQRETAPHRGVRDLRNEEHDRHLHLRAPLPIAMIRRRHDSRIDRRRRALEQSICATPGHVTAVRTLTGRGLSDTIALPFSITGVCQWIG
jgi:hypothetical protein